MPWFLLIIALLVILFAAEMFTNAVEWFGVKLKLAQGAVGSILAAVGTALPETLIPIVAIATRGGHGEPRAGEHMGIGAILGAPFMLSTLAMFVTGLAVIIFHKTRKRPIELTHDWRVFRRDLEYFLICFTLATAAAFVGKVFQDILGVCLILAYAVYVYKTIKEESDHLEEPGALHIHSYLVDPVKRWLPTQRRVEGVCTDPVCDSGPHLATIVVQLTMSLVLILVGAKFFVTQVGIISQTLGISALVLALVIAPVATELPEKFNSVIWIGQRKDTLALGNITGAMVFQSSFPVTVGLWFTSWDLRSDKHAFISVVITLIAGVYLLLLSYTRKRIEAWWLLFPLILYLVFLATIIWDIG